jgi:hypothetical protein
MRPRLDIGRNSTREYIKWLLFFLSLWAWLKGHTGYAMGYPESLCKRINYARHVIKIEGPITYAWYFGATSYTVADSNCRTQEESVIATQFGISILQIQQDHLSEFIYPGNAVCKRIIVNVVYRARLILGP